MDSHELRYIYSIFSMNNANNILDTCTYVYVNICSDRLFINSMLSVEEHTVDKVSHRHISENISSIL